VPAGQACPTALNQMPSMWVCVYVCQILFLVDPPLDVPIDVVCPNDFPNKHCRLPNGAIYTCLPSFTCSGAVRDTVLPNGSLGGNVFLYCSATIINNPPNLHN
jgi:hypothetical protein